MDVETALKVLALDQRRSSSFSADTLWTAIAPELWKTTRNPWLILHSLSDERKEELLNDPTFYDLVNDHMDQRKRSEKKATWFKKRHGKQKVQVAYFSMEFGLSESLPIYSGGLGLLAGDHLKACSDLGVPLIGIGLLYQQGYFRQEISTKGEQLALYPFNEPAQLPVEKLPLEISVELPGRTVILCVYKTIVGQIPLYLLDSNSLMNDPADRGITSELYGGGQETRLQQEYVLGIGGIRLLKALDIEPTFIHLNEGHAAFATLERTRGRPFQETFEANRKSTLFTTHTPVAAGFDRFPQELMVSSFSHYAEELGISIETLLKLGQLKNEDPFNMAYLAVRGSGAVNGVSKLHGEVSQKLFEPLGAAVGSVTNGVHIPSWESPEADHLWQNAAGKHRWHGDFTSLEEKIQNISDETLWTFRNASRRKLLEYASARQDKERARRSLAPKKETFDPNVLTIGFSRRFATYKRVDLLLQDEKRLLSLLKGKKVQLIVAGKAHPADAPARALIKKWTEFTDHAPHALFLTDYDILLAERLVQGIDLWLNTPKRPWEASGTSGMKVLVNGGLNFSSLDGWWAEAYAPDVGWALSGTDDAADAQKLYETLEKEIIPLFYEKDASGIPRKWLKMVKASMARLTPQYSTHRMVQEYVSKYYVT
ncbi:MAG: alpha-glucan family phosphorylase [Chlamydiia bacterium]|nr:alpha-glucan family phosphorylase [Chlamydiia bacterium]